MLSKYLNDIQFEWPWILWLLTLLPLILAWQLWTNRTSKRLVLSTTAGLPKMSTWRTMLWPIPHVCRMLALASLIVALAKPVQYFNMQQTEGEGIEIALCLDVSGSMLARDFTPDRLRASIDLAANFIKGRDGDRIALVVFAGQSLSLAPLTTDLDAVIAQLYNLQYGMLSDGTAIGTGLASAVAKLQGGITRSRIVVLLTDGEDTGGLIDPETALQMAKEQRVKVYTIGVGSRGTALMPYKNAAGQTVLEEEKVSIDEALLEKIAAQTGGKYFRATDRSTLENIYTEINQLEKSKTRKSVFRRKEERFMPWAWAAIFFMLGEGIWRTLLARRYIA